MNDPNLQIVALINSAWDHTQRGHTDLGSRAAHRVGGARPKDGRPPRFGREFGFFGVIDIIDQRWDDAVRRGDECIRTALTPFDRELGVIVKGIAQLFRGQVREGAKVLSELRERAIARDDMFTLDCVDPPLGVCESFAGGLRRRNSRYGGIAQSGRESQPSFRRRSSAVVPSGDIYRAAFTKGNAPARSP